MSQSFFLSGERDKPQGEGDKEDKRVVDPGKLYRDCDVVVLPGRGEPEILEREDVGRAVWEYLEAGVKRWEEEEVKLLAEVVKEDAGSNKEKGKAKEESSITETT